MIVVAMFAVMLQSATATVSAPPPATTVEQVVARTPATELPADIVLPRLTQRCTAGCVRYRRSDWGADPDGRMTKSVLPTSHADWTYLSDGHAVTFHLTADADEQRRIIGHLSYFVSARAREVTVQRGQHAPAQEGIDEMLIGCEGLAENSTGETLLEELKSARVLSAANANGIMRMRYELPRELNGWVHEIEWIAGDVPRIVSHTLEIPQPSSGSSSAGAVRVVRSAVVEWEERAGSQLPKIIDRTVQVAQAGQPAIAIGRSRFEVIERRTELTSAEQSRIGSLTIEAHWTVSLQDTGCSAVLGEAVFTFAGHRYEAIKPVTLADLDRPELLLEGARCLD